MWSDERDIIMDLLDAENRIFPAKCPCCGEKEGHVFFYKHDESDRLGSAWAWCSSCKEFSHSRHIIPEWWKNYTKISSDKLCASPEQSLDDNKKEIDEWINTLIANKSEGVSKEETMEDDMNLYEITILPTDDVTEGMVEVVSKMCNCEKGDAEQILNKIGRTLPPVIAPNAGIVIAELRKDRINFRVSPNYKW